jgi:glycosyltransferase involved in cell wall biosynthesis
MQHFVNQEETRNLNSKEYIDELDFIAFNSNWNFEKFFYQYKIPASKCLVIRNAIEKINFQEKPKEKINLIYHTTPWRGLVQLLNVFKSLNIENVELNVCSSTKIYGKKFDDVLGKKFENIFIECKSTKNVNYLGFVENKKIIDLLKKMHIYAFPSIWPETSCISAIESMAAGCEIVTTNLGALYETCSPFGTLVSFDGNLHNLEKKYKSVLLNSIRNFWSDENQEKLKLQHKSINATYSWNVRSVEWKNFFNEARKIKG